MSATDKFPAVTPHGRPVEVLSDVFLVSGSTAMPNFFPVPLPFGFQISCNMMVLRNGGSLTLVNTVRLDAETLSELDALGVVENIIRIGGFHGKHDPFYKDRYPNATVYAPEGTRYVSGFDNLKPEAQPYFKADVLYNSSTQMPVPNMKVHCFNCKSNEVALLLERDDGILLTGDSLQNMDNTDWFNYPAAFVMRMAGFIKSFRVGQGWLQYSEPSAESLEQLLELEFDNVIPSHGKPVIGEAKSKFALHVQEVVVQLKEK